MQVQNTLNGTRAAELL